MMVIKQKFSIDFQYEIIFTRNIFSPENDTLIRLLQKTPGIPTTKVIVVVDQGLVGVDRGISTTIESYFSNYSQVQMLDLPLVVTGGEESKNDTRELVKVLELIDRAKVDRHAYVIAVGGGSVLDMVGFAAAIAHRGIKHIRIPTTTLSQNDSGVGVKNGINYFGKKNFLGTFAPPYAVVNDFLFLESLDIRDWRAGTAEAVKVALIKDKEFFNWICNHAEQLSQRDLSCMEKLVIRCAELHSEHIGGSNDPFEMGSSRPLDFGHWAAHKLEQLSGFELRHGEAVAIGIALDVCYAVQAGYLKQELADQIIDALQKLGFRLVHPTVFGQDGVSINPELLKGLEEFREHLGGQLTIPMIKEIGSKFDVHEMNPAWIEAAAQSLLQKKEAHAD
ncbi:MAG: 3-dehydroquinate synthase [Saprospiraceae bacterium]|nr:3-dehydroquinate synthase [Saprospiraceae bacterium]